MRWLGLLAASSLVPALILGCGGGLSEVFTAGRAGAYLAQVGSGYPTFTRITMTNGSIDPAQVHGWLIYRGTSPGFPATPDALVAVIRGGSPGYYDDPAEARAGIRAAFSFTFMGYNGQETATVDITYDRPALVEGIRYYYKLQRLISPVISIPPLAQSAQATTYNVSPSSVLGQASDALGPITFFRPPALREPIAGANTLNASAIDFVWAPAVAANDYRIEISESPADWSLLAYRANVPVSFTSTMRHEFRTSGTSPFVYGKTYYWRVGARVLGERMPVSGDVNGYIYSEARPFRVAPSPPPPA